MRPVAHSSDVARGRVNRLWFFVPVVVAAVAVTAIWFGVQADRDERVAQQYQADGAAGLADDWQAQVGVDDKGDPVLTAAEGETLPVDELGRVIPPPVNPDVSPGAAYQKRDLDEALPPVYMESGVPVISSTATVGARVGTALYGKLNVTAAPAADDCLQSWVEAELPNRDNKSTFGVEQVCGVNAVVLFGGYSVSGDDFVSRIVWGEDSDELTAALGTSGELRFASAATETGRGVGLVLAAK